MHYLTRVNGKLKIKRKRSGKHPQANKIKRVKMAREVQTTGMTRLLLLPETMPGLVMEKNGR